MAVIQTGDGSTNLMTVDSTSKAARSTLYDVSGSNVVVANKTVAATSQGFFPIMGLDGGAVMRPIRVGDHGTQRTTSEIPLFQDGFEGSSVNGMYQSGSNVTMTFAQAAGVLTLNNGSSTTASTVAGITTMRQFPKYARQPLYIRFRAKIATLAATHELAEFGLGGHSGTTAIIPNGAFFRFKTDGTLAGVISYNGTEIATVFSATPNTTSYYFYDIVIDDDFVKFIVSDAAGAPIIDQQVNIGVTTPFTFNGSHLPTFARVYADGTGGGTAQQLLISAHTVQMLDAVNNIPWPDQVAGMGRNSFNHPMSASTNGSWLSTSQLNPGVAPTAFTPSATAGGNAFLSGEAIINATGTSENLLSVLSFGVPSPYTLFVTDVHVNTPINSVAAVATSATILEFALVTNCSSSNIQVGGGQRILIPGALFSAQPGTVINGLFTGSMVPWQPRTPVMCLPGTYLHLATKVIVGTATASETYRLGATINGYYM